MGAMIFSLEKQSMLWLNEPGWRKDRVATQIRFRNHKYSALTWNDQSYYQSMSSEFRCEDEKVIGTQPHPTHGSTSSHCVLRLNLIKDSFNIVIYIHTYTIIHLVISMASIIPKPNIHLSCQLISNRAYIYHAYHIISSKATKK